TGRFLTPHAHFFLLPEDISNTAASALSVQQPVRSISLTPSYFLGQPWQATPVSAATTTTTAMAAYSVKDFLYFLFNVNINVTLVFL
ncbi:hypothetical protein DPEC_G00039070, partial [Dallia pectoralis]